MRNFYISKFLRKKAIKYIFHTNICHITLNSYSYLRTLAGIIWSDGAASISDCQVFVDSGMTKPKSKNHSKLNSATN